MSFLFRKVEDDDNQQITVSHFGEHKRLHLENSKQNYYIISLRAIIKAIFTSLCFRVCVSACFATTRLSSDEKCPLSCCVLCVRCSFWAFLPRNSVVPVIFCALTCKADTMIALAFSAY